MYEQNLYEMRSLLENQESQKKIYIDTIIKYATEFEEKLRKEKRVWLNEQSIKLGRVSVYNPRLKPS